jgi:hypothetical protein
MRSPSTNAVDRKKLILLQIARGNGSTTTSRLITDAFRPTSESLVSRKGSTGDLLEDAVADSGRGHLRHAGSRGGFSLEHLSSLSGCCFGYRRISVEERRTSLGRSACSRAVRGQDAVVPFVARVRLTDELEKELLASGRFQTKIGR